MLSMTQLVLQEKAFRTTPQRNRPLRTEIPEESLETEKFVYFRHLHRRQSEAQSGLEDCVVFVEFTLRARALVSSTFSAVSVSEDKSKVSALTILLPC